jgi:diguanylate cyclase (GGDEF)-like protein
LACMFKITGLFLACVVLSSWGWANEAPVAEDDLQTLVDRAAEMNITRPARETLEYLDSIEDRLADASPRQLAQLSMIRARAHALKTDHDIALDILKNLLAGDLDPDQRLRALGLSANLAMYIDRFEEGFIYLNQGLAIQEEVNDPALSSDLFGQAAFWHAQLGDPEKGLEYGRYTLELARQSGDVREVCVALEKLGQAKQTMGLYEEALATYQRGLYVCEQAQDPIFLAAMHALKGRLLLDQGHLTEAESWIKHGVEMHEASGFMDGSTASKVDYGRLLLELGRHDEAHTLLHEILETARSDSRPSNHADANYLLAQISRDRGDYRSAWEHLYEYMQTREGLLNVERARLISFHEVQFDLLSREQEIQLLREQARLSSLQEASRAQQRRLELIAYAMGAFIVLLLLSLLIRTLRQRRYFRHLSAHDGLTGLLNHTHFIESAKSLLAKATDQDQSVMLILADVDHFKQFNDRYGHQAGDELLRKSAGRFSKVLSEHGVVGRIGGEEFAACLPELSMAEVTALVGQVRDSLQGCRLSNIDESLTMSFGVAESRSSENFDSLRARADSALYQAKHAGRDRVITAGNLDFIAAGETGH